MPSSSWSRSKGIVVVRWEPAGNSSFIYSIPFFRREIAVRADKRISVMNEILNGIRVIKMYAWEGAFSNVIGELRRLDFDFIRRKWDNFSYEVIKVRANAIFQSLVMGKLFFFVLRRLHYKAIIWVFWKTSFTKSGKKLNFYLQYTVVTKK